MLCAAVPACFLAVFVCLPSFVCDQPRGHDMSSVRGKRKKRRGERASLQSGRYTELLGLCFLVGK